MYLLFPITLLSSCVSALVLHPFITPAPQIARRDTAENICGYYSLTPNGLIETISCSIGTPCLVATNLAPAVGYCSGTDNAPITTIYPYGDWPSVEGCGPGAACCPASMPDVGKYLFNQGATVFLGCGVVPFTYTAFLSASTNAAVQTPAVAAPTTTSLPGSTTPFLSGSTTTPVSDTTPTPVTPLPSQTPTSSSISSTTTITIIVVGAVVALVGGLVFLWFLYMAWKIHQRHKYPQLQYTPMSMHNSTTSLYSGAPVKKSGLSKWAKIATVISPIFAIVGLAVAIYFGLKPQK